MLSIKKSGLQSLLLFLFCCIGYGSILQAQQNLEIYEIQGSGLMSAYTNQRVTTTGIVTAVANDRFFFQTPDTSNDNDELTSDGLMVYSGTRQNINPGDLIRVTGRVVEFDETTEISNFDLEVSIIEEGLPLPSPIILDANLPGDLLTAIPMLERVEGMYVRVNNAMATRPSDSRGRATINAAGTRTFREPGIESPGQNGLPVWDGNPELINFDPNFLLNQRPTFAAGNRLRADGVLFQEGDRFRFLSTAYEFDGPPALDAVRNRTEKEVSIGSINTFVFSRNEPSFNTRKQKLARYVVELLKTPEILAVQEVQSLSVLEELNEEIKRINPASSYTAYLIPGSSTSTFSIQTGFLVSEVLQNVSVRQLGLNQSLSIGGRLHDRPPFLLEAEFKTTEPTPIAVLNLHLRSLNGIEGGDSFFVRTKRNEQAIAVARMVQDLQEQGKNVVVTGDLNAYPFSDGYVDVVNQISGQPSLGAEYPTESIVTPPLAIQSLLIPNEEQYSFIFSGNSQAIDHFLTSNMQRITVKGMEYARGNSDNPESFLNDASVPYRASDHDGLVLYLELEEALDISVATTNLPNPFRLSFPNPFQPELHRIELTLLQSKELGFSLYSLDGRLAFEQPLNFAAAGQSEWKLPRNLAKGFYVLRVFGEGINEVRKVIVE